MTHIFISYRRADTEPVALKIAESLENRFGYENIFIDRNKIEIGESFREAIFDSISKSDVMLVLIGNQWTKLTGKDGMVRLFEDGDVVRAEVEMGLNLPTIRVIPVLINDTWMPEDTLLPKSIRKIVELNAPPVRDYDNTQFSQDMEKLIRAIEAIGKKKDGGEEASEKIKKTSPVKMNVWAIAAIFVLIAALFAFSQRDAILGLFGIISPTTITSSGLEVDERSELIAQHALRVSLQDVADNPRDIVVAPSEQGLALWGYSTSNGDLFAIDIVNGTPHPIGQADSNNRRFQLSEFDNALTTALHYDGFWLWVGDSRNHQLLAFDPTTMEQMLSIPLGDDGQPVSMVSIEDTLWVALQDTGQLTAIKVNHEAQTFEYYCTRERLDVGESPFELVAQESSLWVAYGRGNNHAVRQVMQENCSLGNSIPLDNAIQAITTFDDTLWGVTANRIWHVVDNAIEYVEVPFIGSIGVQSIHNGNGVLWLDTTDNRIVSYIPQQDASNIVLSSNSDIRDLLSFGVQLWVMSDDTAIRFTIPEIIYPNLVSLVWQDDKLWATDESGKMCTVDTPDSCFSLELDSSPVATASSQSTQHIWLSTEDRSIWKVDLRQQTAEKMFTLSQPVTQMVDDGQYLWLSNSGTMLIAIELSSGTINDLLSNSFNVMPPASMTFDGTTLWFIYDMPAQIVSVTYDGDTPRLTPLMPLATDTVLSSTSNNRYIYIAQPGQLMRIDSQQVDFINRFGLDSQASGIVSNGENLWSFNRQSGFIYQHGSP